MRKICKVTVNDEPFLANCGDLLLDWALTSGIDLPHDCRAGVCGACRVRLVEGRVFGGQEQGDDMIHACQARIVSDIAIVTEAVPDQVTMSGQVIDIVRLAPDVIGVDVELPKPLPYLPGQFCKVQYRGFPARSYSPTYPLEGRANDRLLHFHIRRFPDGIVSSELGRKIRIGHRVKITGPYGSAFLRPNHSGSIVLVASGTGFAPMWSIAVAAILESFSRYTCTARCAVWRCFPMSPSFRPYRNSRTYPPPFVTDGQPIICQACRRTMSSTRQARRP
jgi:3-phenylpropionate/trans-cinnamate dioxygenase ferredoxin reductase subunit